MSDPIQSVLSIEDATGTLIYKVTANKKNGFAINVSCTVLAMLASGRVLKLALTASPGATPIELQWTVDRFLGTAQDNTQVLKIYSNSDYFQFQFTQRCVLSKTGYASWRIRITGYGRATCSLTCQDTFLYDGGMTPVYDFLNGGQLQSLPLVFQQRDSAKEFFFLEALTADSIVAGLNPEGTGELCYVATNWLKKTARLSIGNGLELSQGANGADLQLWQSCTFTAPPGQPRNLKMGISQITSADVLKSWTMNVARRYYDGLSVNHAFTLLPELTPDAGGQPYWTALINVQDGTSLDPGKNPNTKQLDWVWYRQDGVEEYPTPYLPAGAKLPANGVSTRVQSVRIATGQANVSGDLGAFRRQDGRPVHLGQLILSSPPQNATENDATVWNLKLRGSVQVDPGSPVIVDPATGNTVEQIVRAGGFALHLLPSALTPDTGSSFELDITADFRRTSPLPTPGPVMPVISCSLSPLPLWDCAPAAEDDLNGDEYAQLYVGAPNDNAADSSNPTVVGYLNEIYTNMQRDRSIVFRQPSTSPVAIADGQWALKYAEQNSPTEKQYVSMQLLFTPHATDEGSLPDDSVLVFSRNPFSFADVHFHPLTLAQASGATTVADWNSVTNEWQIRQINSSPSYMVLPPQVLGEENVTSDLSAPSGIGTDSTVLAMGIPTVVTYATDLRTNAVKVPWDLHRLTTDASLSVSRVDYEMLYGMVASTTDPVDHMRLTEAASLYGDVLGEFPPLDVPQSDAVLHELRLRYLLARLHWSRIHREYRSRLGVYILQDKTAADPESFTDTTHTVARLRLDTTTIIASPSPTEPAEQFTGPSLVPATPPPSPPPPGGFKGGALNGVDQPEIYRKIVTVNNGVTTPGNAAVINPRFSAVGGFGTTRGTFNNGISSLINTISMGRTVTYTVEQVGRIGCHWNRAKHVIVYERTVVPSRQFYSTQKQVAYRGIPLVRKVEEYVEFLQPDRVFSEESAVPQAAFAKGFKCGERKRISVDSAWGCVVPNQGWKVPLWNPDAAHQLPDVYPKPQLYLEIVSPEQTVNSTDQNPSFLTADALLTHPEEVVFYTSFVETSADTDTWKPVETVDYVCYPLVGPDSGVYDKGVLTAIPLPEFGTPPGWEPVTFSIAPPAVGISVTAGIVSTRTPLAAQLTRVTVSRGTRPKPTTVRGLLANDPTALKNYQASASPLAAIPQAFASMRATITAELAAPNTVRTRDELVGQITQLQSAATTLQTTMTGAATDMQSRFTQPYKDAASRLQAQIVGNAAAVSSLLKHLNDDLANPPAASETVRVAVLTQLQQTFQTTWNEVSQWKETNNLKLASMLDRVVRRWSDEIETALASYASVAPFKSSIGTLSPLRRVTIAFHEFHDQITVIHTDITKLQGQVPSTATSLAQAQAFATATAAKAQMLKTQFDATLSQLTRALTNLQQDVSNFDPSLVLLAFHTAGLVGQFETLVDTAFQAASLQSVAAQSSAADALSALMHALAPVASALTALNNTLAAIDSNLTALDNVLNETAFDLLRSQDQVKKLYTLGLTSLQTSVQSICATPAVLLSPLLASCSPPPQLRCGFLDTLAKATSDALTNLANLLAQWINQQVPALFAAVGPLAPVYSALQKLAAQLAGTGAIDFSGVQKQLDSLSGQMRGAVQQGGQYVDQYVRQPLMARYQAVALEATSAMRVLRAFGAPPQVPHLDIQPPVVGFLYDGLAARVPVTPMLARANQAGQILNALGVHLPTVSLADALIPAQLRNFNLTDVLPNFAGLRLPGLFSGVKLPDIDTRNITVTHGWEPQARRAWLQADVNIPFTQRMVVFNAGFVSFVLTNATFAAQSRIQNNGTTIQQSTHGSITGTWIIEIGDSNALISFASTTLAFDEHGKFQFIFKPDHLTLSDSLKSITALIQTFSDPESGFTYGATATGVKCAFALPVPDTSALTSGFTGLKFSTSLALDFANDFTITLAIGVSSKDRPFNFAIFILGGCGYLTAGVVYNISRGRFDPPALEMAIGCSASLAIALGPISGGVYAQFAIELRKNGSGFSTGAFFQITGHVSICGVLSVDLVFRLEASYNNGVMVASGHFSISVKLFMFSFSVSRDVSMQMGSGGQRSTRLAEPPLRASPAQNLVAVLEGPDGMAPGLADAFFPSDPRAAPTLAARYLELLL